MNDNFEKLAKRVKKLTLSKEEKELIRSQLQKFIIDSPVRPGSAERLEYQRSIGLTDIFKLKFKNMPIVAIIAILALLGGGTTFAAQQSLPGDLLYPVKTHVIEPTEEILALSTANKAQLQAQLAELRLQEAEKLAAQGKLTSLLQAEVDSNFTAHANAAQNLVKELGTQNNVSDAASVSSEMESSLRAHGRVLDILGVSTTALKADVEANDSENARVSAEDEIANSTSTEVQSAVGEKLSEVQNKIAEVQSFIQDHSSGVSSSTLAQAEAQIGAADDLVAQGQAKLQAGDYGGAFLLFQQAQRTAQGAKVMLSAEDEFKLNLNAADFEVEDHGGGQSNSTSTMMGGEGEHGNRGQELENQSSSHGGDNGGGAGDRLKVRGDVNATSGEDNAGVNVNAEL